MDTPLLNSSLRNTSPQTISHESARAQTDYARSSGSLIQRFIVEAFLLGDDRGFDPTASLLDAGIIDSMAVLELVAFLEDAFGIAVEDSDLVPENLDSVKRIAAFVAVKKARAAVESET